MPVDAGIELVLLPPRVIPLPDRDHAPSERRFQGIPSLAVSPGGRLWTTWYAGKTPAEDHNNYVVVATSGDHGSTWTETHAVDPDGEGPVRAFDPELWMAPDGSLWSFWAQSIAHQGTVAGVWAMVTRSPDSNHPAWTEPRRLTDGVMMCKPGVLSSGEWFLPASTWRLTRSSARMVVSSDQGRSWTVRGACDVPEEDREFDEHTIVERNDRTLWMLVRTRYGIGESTSRDGGRTWAVLAPSALCHPSARFFVHRLRSGRLLLVKHGRPGESTGRSHLTAVVSHDDGATWAGGLLLDERTGVSYPDGQQGRDDIIRIAYDRSRTGQREILMAGFTEDQVLAGSGDGASLRMTVSAPPALATRPAVG